VSIAEAIIICLDIPIIHESWTIKYNNSKPPLLRTKLIIKLKILRFHPIDVYVFKPIQFAFVQYF
jgi:hypothetical protein